jgi:predicted small lipoprotein YifL
MTRMRVLAASIVLAMAITGCGKKSPAPASNANANQPSNAASTSGNPVGADGGVAGATGVAPSGPAPSGPPVPPPPPITAPAGTHVVIRTSQEISTAISPVGSHFTGVLERPVEVHGVVLFARGTPVAGEVVGEKRKGEFKGQGDIAVVLTGIGRSAVHTSEYVLVNKGRGKRTGAFIGGGGGLGALIGGIAGGGKGALIGGLAGAGAGTAASTTGNKNVIIRPESLITFRLTEPLTQ